MVCNPHKRCPDASVVHATGTGHLQAIPQVADQRLFHGKPNRWPVTTMGPNDLVVGVDHVLLRWGLMIWL